VESFDQLFLSYSGQRPKDLNQRNYCMYLRYETEHLLLAIGNEESAKIINEYLVRNREDFSKWDLKLNDSYFTMEYQIRAVQAEQRIFLKNEGARYYLFLKDDPHRVIGNVSFGLTENKEDHTCIIGYKTDRAERGNGYAYEAASFLIPKIAKDYGVKRFQAEILPENLPSKALIEKLGFHFEKVVRNAHEFDGIERDILLYVLDVR